MGLEMAVFLCESLCVSISCGICNVTVSLSGRQCEQLCILVCGGINICSFSRCKLGTPFQETEDIVRTGMEGRGGTGMVANKMSEG